MNGRACTISTAARENSVRKQAGKTDERAERWHAARPQSERGCVRDTRGEKAVPTNASSVHKKPEPTIAYRTRFPPHKPITVPGLCGQVACPAVAVAMDHPSRSFQFPCETEEYHGSILL